LHPNDHVLWRAGGGGALFGFDIDPGPEPTIDFFQGQILRLGSVEFEVRFTPGHTPGHCILYMLSSNVCFCGDLIFAGSVGRTDLPGASWEQLEKSIRSQIFTLPGETRLLSGHGPETTVGEEKRNNPFVGEAALP
jgi:glyoxylase-like metal-dependent hydrolase (beta-lactamase superfamily II)